MVVWFYSNLFAKKKKPFYNTNTHILYKYTKGINASYYIHMNIIMRIYKMLNDAVYITANIQYIVSKYINANVYCLHISYRVLYSKIFYTSKNKIKNLKTFLLVLIFH